MICGQIVLLHMNCIYKALFYSYRPLKALYTKVTLAHTPFTHFRQSCQGTFGGSVSCPRTLCQTGGTADRTMTFWSCTSTSWTTAEPKPDSQVSLTTQACFHMSRDLYVSCNFTASDSTTCMRFLGGTWVWGRREPNRGTNKGGVVSLLVRGNWVWIRMSMLPQTFFYHLPGNVSCTGPFQNISLIILR